jgi:hypothetical protein
MKEKNLYKSNKAILYERHNYDPKQQTKNVHHVIFRSDGGTDALDNLALLDIDLHDFIHVLVERIDKPLK